MIETSPARRPGRVRRLSTYTAGSVIAAGCSELALVVCYGLLDLAPAVSSTVAWLAGAIPNYWLRGADVSGTARTVAVAAAFLGVYVIMFAVRYVLLDRLFRSEERP